MGVLFLVSTPAGGAWAQGGEPPPRISAVVGEAAVRFALPPSWITGVMRRESGFQPLAVSSAGAVGLMQVMPSTYRDLRLRYGLGPDPAEPRDNVLAGAAYLRELYDRFGPDGFLAAYNAGPERYVKALIGEAALPAETRRYVAQLHLDLGLAGKPPGVSAPTASLFAPLNGRDEGRPPAPELWPTPLRGGSLFVPIVGRAGEAGDGR
jgi:hypothetical protein